MDEIQEKIITVLKETGRPMSSTELEKALGLKWTQFSYPLGKMIKTILNPGGRVLTTPDPAGRGDVFSLAF